MGMEYWACYHSYLRCLDRLTDEEVGRLFRALLEYSATGTRLELGLRESVAFDFIADDIDRQKSAYQAKCDKNRANIAKRYATTEYDRIPPNTTVYESYQEKEKEEEKEEEEIKKESTKEKRFVPPSVEEVAAYCMDRMNGVDPEAFIAFYESNGWKVGRNHMKDWRAAVRTWEKRDKPQKKTMTSFYDVAERMKGEGLA